MGLFGWGGVVLILAALVARAELLMPWIETMTWGRGLGIALLLVTSLGLLHDVTTDRLRILSLLAPVFGLVVIAVGLVGGRSQLALLGGGLIALGALAVLLTPRRIGSFKGALVAPRISSWLVLGSATLIGGLLAIGLGLATLSAEGLLGPAIVLVALGVLCLAGAALFLRYALLLRVERTTVRRFGFETFAQYDRDRRANGWSLERIAGELGRSVKWVVGARKRYEGAEVLRRISKRS